MRCWEKEPLTEDQEALVEKHFKYVEITVRKMTPRGCSEMYREKLYDGALDGLLYAATSFDPTKGMVFKSYAFNKMKFGMFDEIRKMMRAKSGFGRTISMDHPDFVEPPGSEDPMGNLLRDEKIRILRSTIERLPDYQRRPLILFHLRFIDPDTIAGLLNSTRRNIYVSVCHALKTLRGLEGERLAG